MVETHPSTHLFLKNFPVAGLTATVTAWGHQQLPLPLQMFHQKSHRYQVLTCSLGTGRYILNRFMQDQVLPWDIRHLPTGL